MGLDEVDEAAFRDRTDCRLRVTGAPDHLTLPYFVSPDDTGFFFQRFRPGAPIPLGARRASFELRRARNQFVLLLPGCEGLIFDKRGTHAQAGCLDGRPPPLPAGLVRNQNEYVAPVSFQAHAVTLPGPHVVFCTPNLVSAYHWLVENLLPLDMARAYLPRGATLVLPAALGRPGGLPAGFDHAAMLRLLGFQDMRSIELDAPLAFLEDAIWVHAPAIETIPGSHVRAFRDRILRRAGPRKRPWRRLYIRPTGPAGLANADEIESFVQEHDFELVNLEGMPFSTQIALFQEAGFVIAALGDSLANLLFCPAGTRVIELCPNLEFQPEFWLIAQMLGLTYAALPSPTAPSSIDGNLTVSLPKLEALHADLERRR